MSQQLKNPVWCCKGKIAQVSIPSPIAFARNIIIIICRFLLHRKRSHKRTFIICFKYKQKTLFCVFSVPNGGICTSASFLGDYFFLLLQNKPVPCSSGPSEEVQGQAMGECTGFCGCLDRNSSYLPLNSSLKMRTSSTFGFLLAKVYISYFFAKKSESPFSWCSTSL